MSDFFPEPAPPTDDDELEENAGPVWLNPPDDMVPGVVPVELVLGRSDRAVVMLTGVRAFPTGLSMTLHVRTRGRGWRRGFHLNDEVFDGPYGHDQDEVWRRNRLKWGFEYDDGRRATNIDRWAGYGDAEQPPGHPVLSGGGGGGSDHTVDRDYWLWPLPAAGSLMIVCQWLQLGIELTTQRIDAAEIVAAASRAQPIWPRE